MPSCVRWADGRWCWKRERDRPGAEVGMAGAAVPEGTGVGSHLPIPPVVRSVSFGVGCGLLARCGVRELSGAGFRSVARSDEAGFFDALDLSHPAIVDGDLNRPKAKVGDILADDLQPIRLGCLAGTTFRCARIHGTRGWRWRVGKVRRGSRRPDRLCVSGGVSWRAGNRGRRREG
jgi:hypothetical protein